MSGRHNTVRTVMLPESDGELETNLSGRSCDEDICHSCCFLAWLLWQYAQRILTLRKPSIQHYSWPLSLDVSASLS